ncbi:MAG: hypothetical protein E7290_08840 [Lachnospiraceae bacterium]|nr:hypothetical protein [Lachnospiraceae bacterium]
MNSKALLFLSKVADIKAQTTTAQELRKDAPGIAEMIQRYLHNPALSLTSLEQPPRSWQEAKRDARTSHYLTVVEVSQMANQRRRDAEERATGKDEKEQRKSEMIHPDSIERKTRRDELRRNAFERLNISVSQAGYLLYSYDKAGELSIMGDDITPGTYGDQITHGDFTENA